MEEQIIVLIDALLKTKKIDDSIAICREYLKKIPGIVIRSEPLNGEALSGIVEIFSPIEQRIVLKKHKLAAEFRLFPDNRGEVLFQDKSIKRGAWYEILEFILQESRLIKAYEDHL